MCEVLTEIGGVPLTVKIVSFGAALLTMILFSLLWLADRKKRNRKVVFPGEWMNAAGFGLLPAAGVLKAFEQLSNAGKGTAVMEPLPHFSWLTENGKFLPARIEMTAAVLFLVLTVIWLAVRKKELPAGGDLLPICLSLWAGIRIVTESMHAMPSNLYRYFYCGLELACLAWWTVRRMRIHPGLTRTIADWITAALCIAMIVVTAEGILSVGSGIGNLAVTAGGSVLLTALVLTAGSDSRKAAEQAAA